MTPSTEQLSKNKKDKYKTLKSFHEVDASAKACVFRPLEGAQECFLSTIPDNCENMSFQEQIAAVSGSLNKSLIKLGLTLETVIWCNFYVSDVANQEEELTNSELYQGLKAKGVAISVLQASPLTSKIAMLTYHIKTGQVLRKKNIITENLAGGLTGVSLSDGDIEYIYFKNCLPQKRGNIVEQSERLFSGLKTFCGQQDIPLSNIYRTWLYLYDIDNDYKNMCDARKKFFEENNINYESGFPASTGIGGRTKNSRDRVCLDAFLLKGIRPGQIERMEATSHMNPTVDYNVTFERGLEVVFGDRRHFYISGTASISNKGEVLYKGDVVKQTERTLENMDALLKQRGASLENMAYMVIYLRDFIDRDAVIAYIKNQITLDVPIVVVQANICRPEWLVEIEGVGLSGKGDESFPKFMGSQD